MEPTWSSSVNTLKPHIYRQYYYNTPLPQNSTSLKDQVKIKTLKKEQSPNFFAQQTIKNDEMWWHTTQLPRTKDTKHA